jgi:aminopeptidase N
MNADRDQIIEYYLVNKRPIVDTTIVKIGDVLSTNTYQKAGWVLHMLRNRIGDDAFWKGIRMYYLTFKNKNVLTSDFRKIMEEASGTDLKSFFLQWLYRPGHPELTVTWTYSKGVVTVNVRQNQAVPFEFPLDIRLRLPDGTLIEKSMPVSGALERFTIPSGAKPAELVLDPFCRLLFEGTVQGK